VEAGYSKNRKPVTQPLPLELANALREYLASKPADQSVWPGTWPEKASKMIRLDLEACGIDYRDENGLVADFHSLRHCFVALLDRAGVSLKQAMQLARHSDPKLTMARYGRAQLHDLGAAVESLPALMPPAKEWETLRATGTTGRPSDLACTTACTKLAQTADSACDTLRLPETIDGRLSVKEYPGKQGILRAVETDCERMKPIPPAGFEPATYGLGNRRSIP
jgi:hypothetical protein